MTNDISNTTIAILLVLTILVSVIGTWTVLDAAKNTGQAAPRQRLITDAPAGGGQVPLEIVGDTVLSTNSTG